MGWRWACCSAVVVSMLCLAPRNADACTIALPPRALVGYPENGAVAVPTDVVPFYDLNRAQLGENVLGSFELKTSSGEVLSMTPSKTHEWTFSLLPERTLEPETTYMLTARLPAPGGEESFGLTFTTGTGPVEQAPEPPLGSLQHFQFEQPTGHGCGQPLSGTCVALTTAFPVQSTSIDEFGQEAWTYLYTEPWLTDLSGINQPNNFVCERLRTRAANGTYSEPVDLCADGAPPVTIVGNVNITCTRFGIAQDGVLVDPTAGEPKPKSRSSSACSFMPHRPPTSNAAFAGLLAVALLARRGLSRGAAVRWCRALRRVSRGYSRSHCGTSLR